MGNKCFPMSRLRDPSSNFPDDVKRFMLPIRLNSTHEEANQNRYYPMENYRYETIYVPHEWISLPINVHRAWMSAIPRWNQDRITLGGVTYTRVDRIMIPDGQHVDFIRAADDYGPLPEILKNRSMVNEPSTSTR